MAARVHYHTFGCKANQYDTERMRQEAEARGWATCDAPDASEVLVVNTCTVTNQADAEARRFIRRVHREDPDTRIVVAGCSAALRAAEYRGMQGVAAVVEGHDAVAVAGAIEGSSTPGVPPAGASAVRRGVGPTEAASARSPAGVPGRAEVEHAMAVGAAPASAVLTQIELRAPLHRIDSEPIGGELLRARRGASRGWLKVQDGCDRKCSFCATRLARGASRSRAPEEVVAEALLLAESHAELVLTGIHIGHYGRDLEPAWTLSRLTALLLERVPGVRFRLGSIEATEVDDLLVDLLETSTGMLAPHLHMPLQSGADPVLRRMRRWHTREQYRTRALEIAGRVQPLGLGADVIAGFPGETDADHAATRALVEELPFGYLHVFPYSPRAGTVAASLPDPVPQRVAGERARELRELAQVKGRVLRAGRVGSRACVVLEGDGSAALTGDYLRVDAPTRPAGRMRGLFTGTLQGEVDHLYIAWPRESFSN